jgi:hypothetical protein
VCCCRLGELCLMVVQGLDATYGHTHACNHAYSMGNPSVATAGKHGHGSVWVRRCVMGQLLNEYQHDRASSETLVLLLHLLHQRRALSYARPRACWLVHSISVLLPMFQLRM